MRDMQANKCGKKLGRHVKVGETQMCVRIVGR